MITRYQNVFRSRWKALAWAAGVCMTAYCSVPASETDADPAAGMAPAAEPAKHVNPWALPGKG